MCILAAKLQNSNDITSKKVFFFHFLLVFLVIGQFLQCGHTPFITYSASCISNPSGNSTMGI